MNGTVSRLRFQCMNIRDRLSNAVVHTPWLLTKTVLRGITALLALISLSLFAAAIPSWNRNLVHINGPDKGDWQDGIPIAPLALAVIYNAFTTTYALKTGQRVPYHILEVLIDFLICSVLAAALVFATWGGVFNVWETATTTADSSGSMVMCDESSNAFSRECFPELYPLGLIEIAAIGFAVPVWIFHVFLFVHGLVERCTRSRRVNSQATEMIKSLEADDGMNNMPRESYSYT